MAETITFEFPVSGLGKKLSRKNMGIEIRNHIIKVEDDGTAYRNFRWHIKEKKHPHRGIIFWYLDRAHNLKGRFG